MIPTMTVMGQLRDYLDICGPCADGCIPGQEIHKNDLKNGYTEVKCRDVMEAWAKKVSLKMYMCTHIKLSTPLPNLVWEVAIT